MGNSQTGEQLYQEDHVLLRKFSAPQQTSQSGDPAKGLSIPRQSDFDGQWDLITELPKQWGNRDSWRAQTKLMRTRSQKKGAETHKRLRRLADVCLGVSGRGVGRQWTGTGSGALTITVMRGVWCKYKS